MSQARAQALASLCSQAPVFSVISSQDFFSAMSASRTIQAASIFTWTTFWRPLLHYIPAPACCSGYIFLHRHFLQSLFSGFVVFNSFLKAVGEALHSLFHISSLLEPVPIQPSLTWSHCVSFRLHYSPACTSKQFSTSSTFSPRTFFWIFHLPLQDEYKGGGIPHQVLLITLFFRWNVDSSSFCTEGAVAISISCSRGTESPCL